MTFKSYGSCLEHSVVSLVLLIGVERYSRFVFFCFCDHSGLSNMQIMSSAPVGVDTTVTGVIGVGSGFLNIGVVGSGNCVVSLFLIRPVSYMDFE